MPKLTPEDVIALIKTECEVRRECQGIHKPIETLTRYILGVIGDAETNC